MIMEVVMFNMSSYTEWERGVVNRNYHIFQYLLNSKDVSRVIAVDFLPFTFKRAVRIFFENILEGPKGKVIYKDYTTRCTKISDKLFVFSSIDSFFAKNRLIKKLNLVLEKIDQMTQKKEKSEQGISWQYQRVVVSYFPMFIDYFGQLNESLNVFEAVDNWIEHSSFKKYQDRLKDNYQKITEKSDLIFTVAEPLVGFFKNLGREKDLYWLPNGVDTNHFQDAALKTPRDIKKIPHPIIGYLGTIQSRLDFNLLEYLARNNPDKSLVLVGPVWPEFFKWVRRPAQEIRKLKKYKNVYFLGRKSYQQSPNYIKQFDVAINPHKIDEFIKYTYSLKLLEYMACDKPVVSTPPSGAEQFSHLIYIAQDYLDFNDKIQKALNESNPDLPRLRVEAARQQAWHLKGDEIVSKIKEKLMGILVTVKE